MFTVREFTSEVLLFYLMFDLFIALMCTERLLFLFVCVDDCREY